MHMDISIYAIRGRPLATSAFPGSQPCRACPAEREFFIDNLLVRTPLTIEMIVVDRPCAMVPFPG